MHTLIVLLALCAQAPEILWSTVNSGGVYTTVPMGDMDGDGTSDLACGVDYMDQEPSLWCISGASGETIWTSDQCGGFYRDKGMTPVPDVTGDGMADLVLAVPAAVSPADPCVLMVSGANGDIHWSWNAYTGFPGGTGWGLSSCWVEDFTGNGTAEVLGGFATTTQPGTGGAACLEGSTGELLWWIQTEDGVSDLLALPDITGDGAQEIAVAIGGSFYADNTIMVLNGSTGGILWQAGGGGDVMSLCLVNRADTDPCIASCTFTGGVKCFDLAGTQIWERSVTGILLDIDEGPDLNQDGISELALAGDNGGCYCLSGLDGSTVWNYPSGPNTWSVAWADSVIVGGELTPCVAAGSVNGKTVSLINAATGETVWEHSFEERVNNVTVVPHLGLSPSQTVIAGLQDQQMLADHAWALASSLESSIHRPDGPAQSPAVLSNPCPSSISIASPTQGWSAQVFDLAGRRLVSIPLQAGVTENSADLKPGCYMVLFAKGDMQSACMVTVLPN